MDNINDFTISAPKRETLTIEEAEIYSIIFEDDEIGAPVEVNPELKECLSEFVDLGLGEDDRYPKFVDLAYQAIDHGFDAVERDDLHVINDEYEASVICRCKEGGVWKVITPIEKSLIRKFKKNKNSLWNTKFGKVQFANTSTGSISVSGSGGSWIKGKNDSSTKHNLGD